MKRRGFTLIEMLVVIAMIGLLMTMVAGALVQARQSARKARAEAQLRELLAAWVQYYIHADNPALPSAGGLSMTDVAMQPLMGGGNDSDLVLIDAVLREKAYRDPWGTPYEVQFIRGATSSLEPVSLKATVYFMNRDRE